MTPSRKGRTTCTPAGVRPIMRRASPPTAMMEWVRSSSATTEGSCSTMPLPLTYTRMLAVPRSMPMSLEKKAKLKSPYLRRFALTALKRAYGQGRARG